MVVRDRVEHQLAGAVLGRDPLELRPHGVGRSHDDAPAGERVDAALRGEEVQRLVHRRHRAELPAPGQRDRGAPARGEPLGLLVRLGADRADRDGDVRLLEPPHRPEPLAVERPLAPLPGLMKSATEYGRPHSAAQTALCGDDPEQPDLGRARRAREPGEPGEGMVRREAVLEVGEQLGELLAEVVGEELPPVALEREDRLRVGAGRAADAEVDAVAVQPAEDAERLGDLERAVVRQHHAAAPDPDAGRRRRDRADQDLGRAAGEHRCAVVLGDPVALVPEPLGEAGEVDRVAQRVGAGLPLGDRRLVEDGEPQRRGQGRRGTVALAIAEAY